MPKSFKGKNKQFTSLFPWKENVLSCLESKQIRPQKILTQKAKISESEIFMTTETEIQKVPNQ